MGRSDDADLHLFVQRLAIRSALSEEDKDAILALPTRVIVAPPKRDIVRLYERTAFSNFIAAGMVGRYGQALDGTRQITAIYLPGEVADLDSAIRPIGSDGLNALCETTMLSVPHSAIRALIARSPTIAAALWHDCLLDTAIRTQWVLNVGRRDARTRLAHLLCEIAIRASRDGRTLSSYPFPLTQEQIGDATALTAVHVNRSLKALAELVTVKAGTVKIHDWPALMRAGQFDASYLIADVGTEPREHPPGGAEMIPNVDQWLSAEELLAAADVSQTNRGPAAGLPTL
jgi:CRP-like cAMP-binding protein